jgi:hypothetical protein
MRSSVSIQIECAISTFKATANWVFRLVFVWIVSSHLPAFAQDVLLSGVEIRAEIVDKKIFARSAGNGRLFDLLMRGDGSMTVAFDNNFSDVGRYRITEDGYCASWEKIRKGVEACFKVVRRQGKFVVLNANDNQVSAEIIRVD